MVQVFSCEFYKIFKISFFRSSQWRCSVTNKPTTNNHLVSKRTRLGQFGLILVYKLSGCGFKSRCCNLNFRYHACFKQRVPCRFTMKPIRDMIISYSQLESEVTGVSLHFFLKKRLTQVFSCKFCKFLRTFSL